MSAPNDDFQPGDEGVEGPSGTDTQQDDYTSRTGQKQAPVPVQDDADPVDDPIDADVADSDQQLSTILLPLSANISNVMQSAMMLMPLIRATLLKIAHAVQRKTVTRNQAMKKVLVMDLMGEVELLVVLARSIHP